jgi:cell division septation protein DedD
MAGVSRGRGDVALGGRHLAGIFALLVVVLGIVFTLGYLLGRSRYEDKAGASASVATGAPETGGSAKGVGPAPGAASGEPAGRADAPPATWDFYRSGQPAKTPERLGAASGAAVGAPPKPVSAPVPPPEFTAAKTVKDRPATSATPTAASGQSALIPRGAITLQVAALLREADALSLAQVLQEKKFPAIVTTPSTDKYYRVQVGPYPDNKSANAARAALEKQGFKPLVRR